MKILIRSDNKSKWQVVESASYRAESDFQRFIANEPSLVSLDEIREGAGGLIAVIREVPLDIGSIDVLGFTTDGDIAIIECKLAKNADIKRRVIGQLLDYGAALWRMDYDALDQAVFKKINKTLIDLMKESNDDPEWNEQEFRSGVSQTLKDGSFILMIIVDEIDEELTNIIQFINNSGNPAFSIAAFELQRFDFEGTEVLVPHVFGLLEKERSRKRTGKVEYRDFFKKCTDALRLVLSRDYSIPTALSYYKINTGIGGVHFEWGFHGQPRSSFGTELHFENANREKNVELFSRCERMKEKLEEVLGERVIFQKAWGRAWSRLYIEKNEAQFTDELKDWAVSKMKIMIDILQSELDMAKKTMN